MIGSLLIASEHWSDKGVAAMDRPRIVVRAVAKSLSPAARESERTTQNAAGARSAAAAVDVVDKTACWRWGWHGWGWYPCLGGPGWRRDHWHRWHHW